MLGPNIIGDVLVRGANINGGFHHTALLPTGALSYGVAEASTIYNIDSTTTGTYLHGKLTVNASESNAIYGNSATVQPSSLSLNALIKY
jgi:hypothetical protein